MRERLVITGTPEVFMPSGEQPARMATSVPSCTSKKLEKEGWEAAVKHVAAAIANTVEPSQKENAALIFPNTWATCDLYFAWTSEFSEVKKIPMLLAFRISAADERTTSRPRIHVTRRALPVIPPYLSTTSKLACWNAQRTPSQKGNTSRWQRPTSASLSTEET